ncbi:DNA cytosine methyltransferase [Devosia sp. SD17-2]|uniref:DNA cytosine methyltransferase n=1 Tax=Devosia sp. SD17-2 TaxID=2976459 RepID=UPI0023D82D6C|nr:DNA cytosine methyltransferase [Devosia sp. SD17-2]WEJ31722.1 DNA cytosine methyltransferase [Devosia sp. SD17-2]
MNGKTYYNEWDQKAAAVLRARIADGSLPDGDVDTRSIEDVTADDLQGYVSCHFFAGIGGWPLALRQAGWPDDRPVWTGSCPCQPFSRAGKGLGFADERHLWPSFHWLIQQCRPPVIFGEQVAGADADPWIDLIQFDLEALDYAVGAVPFPAAGVGAPHIRDRLYWVADTESGSERWPREPQASTSVSHRGRSTDDRAYWSSDTWILCSDGKRRPIEPGILPMADGLPGAVDSIAAYGNAVVVPAAREFIAAYLDYYMARDHQRERARNQALSC